MKHKEERKMAISDKQRELDELKWQKSERLGFDACGSFNYCHFCDKYKENPCEKAYNKMEGIEDVSPVVVAETQPAYIDETPAVEKKPAKKTTTKKKSTTKKKTTKKKTTKKSTAKKSTTKKSTTK